MSFKKVEMWVCEYCGSYPDDPHMSKCPNPDCPSNKKEKSLVELIKPCKDNKFTIYDLSIDEAVELRNGLVKLAADAGEDGKIVGLTREEIANIIWAIRYGYPNSHEFKSVLKKLEAK